jgi:hypothetical protein
MSQIGGPPDPPEIRQRKLRWAAEERLARQARTAVFQSLTEAELELAVERVQDWVMPRLEHSSAGEAMRLRGVVRNAIRELLGQKPERAPEVVQMIKRADPLANKEQR